MVYINDYESIILTHRFGSFDPRKVKKYREKYTQTRVSVKLAQLKIKAWDTLVSYGKEKKKLAQLYVSIAYLTC